MVGEQVLLNCLALESHFHNILTWTRWCILSGLEFVAAGRLHASRRKLVSNPVAGT